MDSLVGAESAGAAVVGAGSVGVSVEVEVKIEVEVGAELSWRRRTSGVSVGDALPSVTVVLGVVAVPASGTSVGGQSCACTNAMAPVRSHNDELTP